MGKASTPEKLPVVSVRGAGVYSAEFGVSFVESAMVYVAYDVARAMVAKYPDEFQIWPLTPTGKDEVAPGAADVGKE